MVNYMTLDRFFFFFINDSTSPALLSITTLWPINKIFLVTSKTPSTYYGIVTYYASLLNKDNSLSLFKYRYL